MRLLLVEDEKQIADPLIGALKRNGYAVDYAEDGQTGYDQATLYDYDCILLDLNLPEMDGIEVAKKLRENSVTTPILMLTARTRQDQVWEGFESGTDDYLTKPFDLKELQLRINALIKRSSKVKAEILSAGKVVLDPKAFSVIVDGKEISLNNKEFGILEYLIRNKGNFVSTEELLEHVWDSEIDMFTQTVRTNMKTLRQKVDPDKKLIVTIRGKGYVIR